MALFNDFPFTNLHGINLTWIIQQVKKCAKGFEELNLEFNELKEYVLENLNEEAIKEDIKEEFEKLLESGVLEDIIKEVLEKSYNKKNYFGLSSGENFEQLTDEELATLESAVINYEELKTQDYYNLYDALMRENSDVMSKTIYGLDDFGNELAYYTIKSRLFESLNSGYYTETGFKPSVILTTGVHGLEKSPIISLYLLIKRALNNRSAYNSFLNRDLYIVPCCNPWGINNTSRLNGNGVDINRNFPYMWESGTSPEKGSSAGSEKETQFLMNLFNEVMLSSRRWTFVIDCHSFRYDVSSTKMVLNVGTNFISPINTSAVGLDTFSLMVDYMKTNYPYMQSTTPDNYAEMDNAKGASGLWYGWAYAHGGKTAYIDVASWWTNTHEPILDEYKASYFCVASWVYVNICMLLNEAPYTIVDWKNIGIDDPSTATWTDVINGMPRYSEARLLLNVDSNLLNKNTMYFSADTEFVTLEIKRGERNVPLHGEYNGEYYLLMVTELLPTTVDNPPNIYTAILRFYGGASIVNPNWVYSGNNPKGRTGSSEYGSANMVRDVNSPDFIRQLNKFGWYCDFYTKEDALANHLPMGDTQAGFLIACRPVVQGTRCFVYFYFTSDAYMFYKMGRTLDPTAGNWMQVKKDRYDNPT